VSGRVAPSGLSVEARRTAWRMAAAGDARRRTAPNQLKTARAFAWRMAAAGDVSTRVVSRLLHMEERRTARRTAGAGDARRRVVPSQHKATRGFA
jgi:hypothetical protein